MFILTLLLWADKQRDGSVVHIMSEIMVKCLGIITHVSGPLISLNSPVETHVGSAGDGNHSFKATIRNLYMLFILAASVDKSSSVSTALS